MGRFDTGACTARHVAPNRTAGPRPDPSDGVKSHWFVIPSASFFVGSVDLSNSSTKGIFRGDRCIKRVIGESAFREGRLCEFRNSDHAVPCRRAGPGAAVRAGEC